MARKMIKITINHHNSGGNLSTTTSTETTPTAISFHREEIPQLEVCMLNMQLTNLKVEFQAGKTKQHLCDLKHLTSAIQILQTVSGLPIELTDELEQTHTAQK